MVVMVDMNKIILAYTHSIREILDIPVLTCIEIYISNIVSNYTIRSIAASKPNSDALTYQTENNELLNLMQKSNYVEISPNSLGRAK